MVTEITDKNSYEQNRMPGFSQVWELGNLDEITTGVKPLRLSLDGYSFQIKFRKYNFVEETFVNFMYAEKFDDKQFKNLLKELRRLRPFGINTIVIPNEVKAQLFKEYESVIDLENPKPNKKRRQNIRKAVSAGVTFRMATKDDIPAIVALENEFAIKKGMKENISFNQKYIEHAFGLEECKVFCILQQNTLLGFEMVWIDNKSKMTGSGYGACNNRGLELNAPSLLKWEIIKWSKENGYKKFDIGSILKKSALANVGRFKKSFNGNIIPYYTYREFSFISFGVNLRNFASMLKMRQSED
jgi:lipid II:glycine glycyltransferase (peptidoglycan interpeptide bridge formation enzyme)